MKCVHQGAGAIVPHHRCLLNFVTDKTTTAITKLTNVWFALAKPLVVQGKKSAWVVIGLIVLRQNQPLRRVMGKTMIAMVLPMKTSSERVMSNAVPAFKNALMDFGMNAKLKVLPKKFVTITMTTIATVWLMRAVLARQGIPCHAPLISANVKQAFVCAN